ncbi:MAG: asparagine synthase-related protein, partial [Methanobrevibacter wolinii]
MCGILGLYGKFKGNDILSMMKIIERRGTDAHGVYLENDETTFFDNNIDINAFNDDNEYNVGFGHNLLSISNFYNEDNLLNLQPKKLNNLVLSFNGEIYNYKEVLDFLKSNLYDGEAPKSDCDLLMQVLNYYYNKNQDLLEAVQYTNRRIDGDYVYAIYDGENIALSRDSVGVKPLFYGENDTIRGFASERKALWKVGITDVKTLEPGHILYNYEDIEPKYLIYDYESNKNHKYETYIKYLDEYLNESVKDRIANIDDIGLVFSGGVDSTLLLYYILDNLEDNQTLKLYTVGNENSQDLKYARRIAEDLNLPLRETVINEDVVREFLDDTLL